MSIKKCNKCGEPKSTDSFYPHPNTADKLQGCCKECQKEITKAARERDRKHYSDYDRERQKTESRRLEKVEIQRRMRAKNPEKYRARYAVTNAIRNKRLLRLPCEVCDNVKSQAHHADYSKPLEVRWLCFKHHRELEHGQVVTVK